MNIAFAGFRHGHIFGLYHRAEAMEGVNIIGAWEQDDAARTAAQSTVSEPFFETYDALLADERVDAVAVGDYYGARGALIIKALRAGKHVIADKPLCTSLEELYEIHRLASEKKLRVDCMLDLRYDGAIRTAKKLIADGRIGTVHAMAFTGQHPLNYGVRPMWYFEEGKHGGVINDIAIHGIDALRYMTDLEFVRTVAAREWNAYAKAEPAFKDCAQFMAEYEGGAGVIADVSYAAQAKTVDKMPSYWRFTIWGEKGCIEFKFGEDSIKFVDQASDDVEIIACEKVTECWLDDFVKPFDEDALIDVIASAEAALRIQNAAK
jgi:predicted dehydrogenase